MEAARVAELARQAVGDGIVPALAWAVFRGTRMWQGGINADPQETFFDLASLTKALGTSLAVASVVTHGRLNYDGPMPPVIPGCWSEGGLITLRHLLEHTSGLPGYVPFYETCSTAQELVLALNHVHPSRPPGLSTEYSDLGYMLLGRILEAVCPEGWPGRVEEIYDRLGLGGRVGFQPGTVFAQKLEQQTQSPPAMVHDEHGRLLGPSAGHAGLWGTARGVAELLRALGQERKGTSRAGLSPAVLEAMFPSGSPPRRFSLGWDTPDPEGYTSAGQGRPVGLFGHLGFTGTACWFDPLHEIGAVLLTNRTHLGREVHLKELRALRPLFFTACWELTRCR